MDFFNQNFHKNNENDFRKSCEVLISNLSLYIDKDILLSELKKMNSNPREYQKNFFHFLRDQKIPIEEQIKIFNHPFAFRFANRNLNFNLFSINAEKPLPSLGSNDSAVHQFIKKFLEIRGNPVRASDFLRILQDKKMMNDNDFSLFCKAIDWIGIQYPLKSYRSLGVTATIGWKTKQSISSYTRVEFPIGYPKRSGQSPQQALLCNHDWVACEYQSDDSRRHTAIIPQVNELLEGVEDKHTQIDIQIIRNMNTLMYFLTKGEKCVGFDTQMILNEMMEIYGKGGTLILSLYKRMPEKFRDVIINRLRCRAVNLRIEKINKLPQFASDLERLLPPQRSKYQTAQSIKNAFPQFSSIGQIPIRYDIDQVSLIGQLVDIYIEFITNPSNSTLELEKMRQYSKNIMAEIRKSEMISASFNHAAALCAAAMLTDELAVIKEIDKRTNLGVKVAVDIGITSEDMHGHSRLLRIAVDTVVRRKWTDGAREVSGMFFEINLTKAIHIIRTINLFLKCISQYVTNDVEQDLIHCLFKDDTISVVSAANQDFMIYLDLTRFEQM